MDVFMLPRKKRPKQPIRRAATTNSSTMTQLENLLAQSTSGWLTLSREKMDCTISVVISDSTVKSSKAYSRENNMRKEGPSVKILAKDQHKWPQSTRKRKPSKQDKRTPCQVVKGECFQLSTRFSANQCSDLKKISEKSIGMLMESSSVRKKAKLTSVSSKEKGSISFKCSASLSLICPSVSRDTSHPLSTRKLQKKKSRINDPPGVLLIYTNVR